MSCRRCVPYPALLLPQHKVIREMENQFSKWGYKCQTFPFWCGDLWGRLTTQTYGTSTEYGWALCSSFPRSFGFFLVGNRPCGAKGVRDTHGVPEWVRYVPGPQSVRRRVAEQGLRGPLWALWASVAFSGDMAVLFPAAGFLWWFGSAPHAFWWTSEKWIKKSINAMKKQSTISVIMRKGVGRKIKQTKNTNQGRTTKKPTTQNRPKTHTENHEHRTKYLL